MEPQKIFCKCHSVNIIILYLNQPFFFELTSSDDFSFGVSSVLPLMIIKGTVAHKAKNNIQNK